LLVSELTGFVAKQAMKTAGRANPNRWAQMSSYRAHGAVGQKPSCSFTGAAKHEKIQPLEGYFFLTSPFIERHMDEDGVINRELGDFDGLVTTQQ